MKPPQGLSAGEAALWRRVADTVTPLNPARHGEVAVRSTDGGGSPPAPPPPKSHQTASPLPRAARVAPPRAGEDLDRKTLDGSWDRRLAQGLVAPDAQIDLHGLGIDAAYTNLRCG